MYHLFYDDDFDEFFYIKKTLFYNPKKIDYYKIYTISSNTCNFILTNKNEIQNAINKNNKLLRHLFLREN